ncbi:hypothetical protein PVAND_004673 [Polypedilum vanderplanki]|uniref:Protein FAM114A2 n=1 Tax=Polypedilum vanderplanki TaxID=319348 RepID=A0A9J6BXN6_POLVA|nr:hypothetical protein PVAND_004673 [Polypedilum vanderplanki]
MAESDSEAFESADEEVIEKKENDQQKKIKKEEQTQVTKTNDEPIKSPASDDTQQSSWRSWSAFGMLKSASQNVASLTTHVSQSISTAIESINIPDPEEMAKINANNEAKTSTEDESQKTPNEESGFKLNSLLSNVSSISSKVVSGGLDTLEELGKKTITIIQETDPNIASKLRSMNVSNKPNLSDLLKEAKEREDDELSGSSQSKDLKNQTVSFEHLLDEYKGLVYLEALEIQSNQSKLKIEVLLKPLTGKALAEMQETLTEVEELCELPDADNFDSDLTSITLESKLKKAIEDLSIEVNFTEIINCAKELDQWITNYNDNDTQRIYAKSIEALAKLCALALNNYQKLAELLLSLSHRSTADEADSVSQLCGIYFSLFNTYAGNYSEKISQINSTSDESKKLSTNIFLECSNATSYVKKAFQLFIPILQLGAL